MIRPKTLTFKGADMKKNTKECPFCHIVTWLGVGDNGVMMCQHCYLEGTDEEKEQ